MSEKFAAYGFELQIPDDWRIEFNAKSTRERGDIAFHSPKNNIFFVSWGKLEVAQKRFKSLEEHRDDTVKRIRKNPNMQKTEVVSSASHTVGGHQGIFSEVVAQPRRGLLGRQEGEHRVWSIHSYCPPTGRYYVTYWHLKAAGEYEDPKAEFMAMVDSMTCHPDKKD